MIKRVKIAVDVVLAAMLLNIAEHSWNLHAVIAVVLAVLVVFDAVNILLSEIRGKQ